MGLKYFSRQPSFTERAWRDELTLPDIYSVEKLELHAEYLARTHEISPAGTAGVSLRRRLRANARDLAAAFRALNTGNQKGVAVTPAAAWLVDNFYIVDDHIKAVRRDLPAGFYKELPKLASGALRGYPRVYGVVTGLVAHSDNRFDLETLSRYCRAYQRVQPLTIGELWAIAITLRVMLIENLSRLARGIVMRRLLRRRADALADTLLPADGTEPGAGATLLPGDDGEWLAPAYAAQLFQRLRDHDPKTTPALTWLHQRLSARNMTPEDLVHLEHQRQGAVNVSVRNIITSLRLISSVDWADFFESISLVDELLRGESDYASFDFATRDLYRHTIEELSRRSDSTELEVTRRAIHRAQRAASIEGSKSDARAPAPTREPGYYLVSEGRAALEQELGYRIPWKRRMARLTRASGVAGYAGAILALSLLLTAPLLFSLPVGLARGWVVLIMALGFIGASEIAVAVVNLWVNYFCTATVLPGLELKDGVPTELRTIVAVPILLTSVADINESVRNLEVHFLASQDGDIRFALLSDWLDSDCENAAGDTELLAAVARGIEQLNRVYGRLHDGPRFLLFHRRRLWNGAESRWMGWERKRGKLQEFNALLRGSPRTSFMDIDGVAPSAPAQVRYVICLDADTRLPRGAAVALIGKMAHPLNAPKIDAADQRVTQGYGILQPRVTPSLPQGHDASLFQSIFSGPSGLDPYAFAVSDVYQDLFDEGSFSGKGIYEVEAFERALANRVPENALLSHDLFEGIYARSGLATDVEVVEEYPARYEVAAGRQHRWTRGDWQLLPWVVGRASSLTALGRWKMADNLRRSLVAPAVLTGLTAAWATSATLCATTFFLAAIVLPVVLPWGMSLISRLARFAPGNHIYRFRDEAVQTILHVSLQVIFLADQAWMMTDAIIRTLFRLGISHKNMLQWTTTAQVQRRASNDGLDYLRNMSGGILLTLAGTLLLFITGHPPSLISAPVLVAWLCAPLMARAISVPATRTRSEPLSAEDIRRLRLQARETWSFFDTFVTPVHHWLPPDNFQETPQPVIANRTSPTNIGLYLLSVAAAREFGWIGSADALDRLGNTLSTLEKLETFRGHFYNWYDTHDLRPLDPKYISTVDSGNLAGHLVTLVGAMSAWGDSHATLEMLVDGLLDTLEALQGVIRSLEKDDRRNYGVSPRHVSASLEAMRGLLRGQHRSPAVLLAAVLDQADGIQDLAQALNEERGDGPHSRLLGWSRMLRATVFSHQRDLQLRGADAAAYQASLESIARRATQLALAMEFGFLVQAERQLLSIGYRVADRAQDPSCYDLLASEARLASFIAIAKGDLPVRHWFRLGRRLTAVGRSSALISWSGSMFEYLMPILVMREPLGSVLGETARTIVQRQIQYGRERKLPWGVSESALNARDREFTYQYSSFGVPGLGLQRGLGEEAVVAPYATGLAVMVEPQASVRNFERLQVLGARGDFGWYDAMDFTPSRLPAGVSVVPVRAYMAHHQGMTLVAIANVLLDGLFRRYFHSHSLIRANELLLQEKSPQESDLSRAATGDGQSAPEVRDLMPASPRRFTSPHQANPRTHLLSNGSYSVMVTTAGSGYSRWRDMAVTRWREDATLDPWGSYVFLRDVAEGEVWSAGYQPVGREPDSYAVEFFEDRAEISRRDGQILTSLEILVSPEEDGEVRRVSITNEGNRVREIEITTYTEVVLAASDADAAHPAFSKLFVRTEFLADSGALLATRRGRDPSELQPWLALVSALEGEAVGGLQFETDRARFLGRARELREALSIVDARPLSGTAGVVLDPVFSLRRRVRVAPGDTVRIAFWMTLSASRADALALIDKHRDMASFDRVKTLAWTQAQVQLRYLGIDFEEAQQFQRIANRVLYADASLRAPRETLESNQLGQSALWAHGISGDLPVVLVRIDNDHDLDLVKQLLRAHEYWRLKRLAVDLVIVNERLSSYISDLHNLLLSVIRTAQVRHEEDKHPRGAVFLLRADLISTDESTLLQSIARAVFVARRGTLADQLARLKEPDPKPRRRLAHPPGLAWQDATPSLQALEFFNGVGGFAADAREYVIVLKQDQSTPAPWSNVVANADFGFIVSAEGAGTTWSVNSQQNRLTPWSNDPVATMPAEVIYVRDDESAELWSATPLPIRDVNHPYIVRHGFGYSRFQHESHGIALDLLQFVPLGDSVKISRLRVTNRSDRARQLSLTQYLEWVLGTQHSKTALFVVTELDPITLALLARNPWNGAYASRVAFLDMSGRQQSFTADRAEFLGRHGSLAEPAALLTAAPLSNRVGGGLDPCAALQTKLRLLPGEATELVFLLGDAPSRQAAAALVERYRAADLNAVLREVAAFWDRTLGAVQVKTPDRAMDILLNGWLLYQTLACRVWGRTAFYQSSGAYGFRDQLQDVMALCVAQPAVAREHILRAAARQFGAGDVQHWWLPVTGQGVQTRVADDRIWLPFVTAHYLKVTGDLELLDEYVPFLAGDPLAADLDELFAAPAPGPGANLFEHCIRALDSSLEIGSHGLPLFGTGDWNDGMNRVGMAGRGESVWLAWFLYAALLDFAPVAERRGNAIAAARWRKHAFALQRAVEREAWDGEWYRRGYFDDGTPLGSVSSDECRIDSIAQSWAVISGAGDAARSQRAMAAVNAQLVNPSEGLVQLFTPPFDRSLKDPGYIKAYPPGIRENGGQYTHAALWTVLAFALSGDGDRAAELFSLINPINHASTRTGIHRYKVEPYVACADVYAAPSHIGRGGWTWYTGSAAWMYRTALEALLGFNLRGPLLCLNPCIPRAWRSFELLYRYRSASYRLRFDNPQGVSSGIVEATLDGVPLSASPCEISLRDDGREHVGVIRLGVVSHAANLHTPPPPGE